jgi:hypothetical protein
MERKYFLSQITQIDGTTQHFFRGMESIHLNLHPCKQMERFDELSARSPITIIADTVRCIVQMKTRALRRYPSWRHKFRPCALGLIGLGIAVAFWGFGYKLSLYHGHASPSSRIPVARLWIEPRGAFSPATSRIRAKSYLSRQSPAISVPISRPPHLDSAGANIPPVFRRGITYFDFLIPFRSPPPQSLCLA